MRGSYFNTIKISYERVGGLKRLGMGTFKEVRFVMGLLGEIIV